MQQLLLEELRSEVCLPQFRLYEGAGRFLFPDKYPVGAHTAIAYNRLIVPHNAGSFRHLGFGRGG